MPLYTMELAFRYSCGAQGVVSPILSNSFLHYAFDLWMARTHPDLPWCRYADDGLVHCRSEQEAQALKAALQVRLAACGRELHSTKTKVVYCQCSKHPGRATLAERHFRPLGQVAETSLPWKPTSRTH